MKFAVKQILILIPVLHLTIYKRLKLNIEITMNNKMTYLFPNNIKRKRDPGINIYFIGISIVCSSYGLPDVSLREKVFYTQPVMIDTFS